jgi:hypothetical protein
MPNSPLPGSSSCDSNILLVFFCLFCIVVYSFDFALFVSWTLNIMFASIYLSSAFVLLEVIVLGCSQAW